MDRGIPTEAILVLMRASAAPVHYLVGTPRGRLSKLEKSFLTKPWAAVRDQVTVKLLDQDGELYVLACSAGRQDEERAMRQRRLKRLWTRLQELQRQDLSRVAKLVLARKAMEEAVEVWLSAAEPVAIVGWLQPPNCDAHWASLGAGSGSSPKSSRMARLGVF